MKVYTVIHTIKHDCEWTDAHVSGVFSSKEKAIKAILNDLLKQYNEEITAYYNNKYINENGNSYMSRCLDHFRSRIHFVNNEYSLFELYFRRKFNTDWTYNGYHIYGVAEFDLDAKELTNDNANDS